MGRLWGREGFIPRASTYARGVKFLLVVIVLAVVAFLAYRRIRGSGSTLDGGTDRERLRDEFRGHDSTDD